MVKLVRQVGTTLNPVQFFKSLHSLAIEYLDLLCKLLSLCELACKSSLV